MTVKRILLFGVLLLAAIALLAWPSGPSVTWKTPSKFVLQVKLELFPNGRFKSVEHPTAMTKPAADVYMTGRWAMKPAGVDLSIESNRQDLFGKSTTLTVFPREKHIPLRGGRLYWFDYLYLEKV